MPLNVNLGISVKPTPILERMIKFRLSPFIARFALAAMCFVCMGCSTQKIEIGIHADLDIPQIAFAVEELEAAFQEIGKETRRVTGPEANVVISIGAEDGNLKTEGFSIEQAEGKIRVTGADAAGAMYGGLELAEQVRLYGPDQVKETLQNPYMERRGTKFNIPLDARTPSYTDVCDAAQKNIPEMWSMDFWTEYIDNLARYRFNYISLWSLHPFPSMVRVPGYEEVALADVHRSTTEWKEYYLRSGLDFVSPEILANPEIVKVISIEEKMEFWKQVMRYAKERNIDFYVVTWNIFVHGTDGK